MRAVAVVFVDTLGEFDAHIGYCVGQQIAAVVEFFLEGPVAARLCLARLQHDAAVVFRSAGRQHDERNSEFAASVLKLSHELRAAIHLD